MLSQLHISGLAFFFLDGIETDRHGEGKVGRHEKETVEGIWGGTEAPGGVFWKMEMSGWTRRCGVERGLARLEVRSM